jgi:hypothetical protein
MWVRMRSCQSYSSKVTTANNLSHFVNFPYILLDYAANYLRALLRTLGNCVCLILFNFSSSVLFLCSTPILLLLLDVLLPISEEILVILFFQVLLRALDVTVVLVLIIKALPLNQRHLSFVKLYLIIRPCTAGYVPHIKFTILLYL